MTCGQILNNYKIRKFCIERILRWLQVFQCEIFYQRETETEGQRQREGERESERKRERENPRVRQSEWPEYVQLPFSSFFFFGNLCFIILLKRRQNQQVLFHTSAISFQHSILPLGLRLATSVHKLSLDHHNCIVCFSRCKIPGYTNDTYDIQGLHHAWLVNQTIPMTADGDYTKCTVYDVILYDDGLSAATRTQRDCDEWVYDKSVFTETLTSQVRV